MWIGQNTPQWAQRRAAFSGIAVGYLDDLPSDKAAMEKQANELVASWKRYQDVARTQKLFFQNEAVDQYLTDVIGSMASTRFSHAKLGILSNWTRWLDEAQKIESILVSIPVDGFSVAGGVANLRGAAAAVEGARPAPKLPAVPIPTPPSYAKKTPPEPKPAAAASSSGPATPPPPPGEGAAIYDTSFDTVVTKAKANAPILIGVGGLALLGVIFLLRGRK